MLAWVVLPITPPGSPRGSPSSIGAASPSALGQRLHRDLDPGPDHAAQVLALGGDRVEGDRGAEVHDRARPAEPLVGGDRVDEPVGAELVRVVDPDRHPGLDARADDQAAAVEVALAHRRVLGRRAAARPRRRSTRRPRPSRRPRSPSRVETRTASSSAVASRVGREAPVLDEVLAVEDARGGSACCRRRSRAAPADYPVRAGREPRR